MSVGETEAAEDQEAEAGEPRQMSERTAKAIVLVIAGGALVGVVIAFPYIAYFVAGLLACRGWDKARALRARRTHDEPTEEEGSAEDVDVVDVLQRLDRSVLLTELKTELQLPDTKAVKALLDAAGIPWKGVRTNAGNGPGVHHDDIPAPSPAFGDDHGEGCCCRSEANANTNNADREEPGEGLRVQRIGSDGYILYDPKDTVRHHRVK